MAAPRVVPSGVLAGRMGPQGNTGPQGPPGPGTGAGAWQPTTGYTANQVVQAPDGSIIYRIANGTSRASFDATEKALWATVTSKAGTMEADALSASYARVVSLVAPDNGSSNAVAAIEAAATAAAAAGADVYVPAPAVSYKLNSNPTIPDGVSFLGASPEWFSGTGKMPFHLFTEISEGVDPRIFATKYMGYTQNVPGENRRKWSVVGWVWAKFAPDATAAAAQEADMVGVDGRGVADIKNGRVWGGLFLAHMTALAKAAGSYGVSQAYGLEVDVNNNTGDHSTLAGDGTAPVVVGQSTVSGGTNRPGEAHRVDATRKNDGSGDNRWTVGVRVMGDVIKDYYLLLETGFKGVVARIPSGSGGFHYTHADQLRFADYQDVTDLRRKFRSYVGGYGFDWINPFGTNQLSIHDGSIQAGVPFRRVNRVAAATATLDANLADTHILTAGATTITAISNGYDGQRLTIVNVTGGNLTVNRASNVRTAAGANIVLANTGTIEFIYSAPTWFQVASSINNA